MESMFVTVSGFARPDFSTSQLAVGQYPWHGHTLSQTHWQGLCKEYRAGHTIADDAAASETRPCNHFNTEEKCEIRTRIRWSELARRRIYSISHGLNTLSFTLADGSGFCLGDFSSGKGGFGDSPEHPIVFMPPKRILPAASTSRLLLGDAHGVSLSRSGIVYTFGDDRHGAVSAGTGVDGFPGKAFGLGGSVASCIAAGSSHTAVILRDGCLRVFGSNRNGQLGISVANVDELALVPTPVPLFERARDVDAHRTAAAPQKKEKEAAVDPPGYSPAEVPREGASVANTRGGVASRRSRRKSGWMPRAETVSAGRSQTAVVTTQGEVAQWGDTSDVLARYSPPQIPSQLSGVSHVRVVQVSVGASHAILLGSEGSVHTWGRNDYGQLGLGVVGAWQHPEPLPVPGLLAVDVQYISAGERHSVALLASGGIGRAPIRDSAFAPVVPGLPWANVDSQNTESGRGKAAREPHQVADPAGAPGGLAGDVHLDSARNGPAEPAVVLQWGEGVPFPHVVSTGATLATCGDGVTVITKDYPIEFIPLSGGSAGVVEGMGGSTEAASRVAASGAGSDDTIASQRFSSGSSMRWWSLAPGSSIDENPTAGAGLPTSQLSRMSSDSVPGGGSSAEIGLIPRDEMAVPRARHKFSSAPMAIRSRPIDGCPRVTPQAARTMAKTWRRDLGDAIWTEMCIGGDWTRGIRLNHNCDMTRTRRPSRASMLEAGTNATGTPPMAHQVPQAAAVEVDSLRHGLLRMRDLEEAKLQQFKMQVSHPDSIEQLSGPKPHSRFVVILVTCFAMESRRLTSGEASKPCLPANRGIVVQGSPPPAAVRAGIVVHRSVLEKRVGAGWISEQEHLHVLAGHQRLDGISFSGEVETSPTDKDTDTDIQERFQDQQEALSALVQYWYLGSLPALRSGALHSLARWSTAQFKMPRLAASALFMLAPLLPRLPSAASEALLQQRNFDAGTASAIGAAIEASSSRWPQEQSVGSSESGSSSASDPPVVSHAVARRMALAQRSTDQLLQTKPICIVDVDQMSVGVEFTALEVEGSSPDATTGESEGEASLTASTKGDQPPTTESEAHESTSGADDQTDDEICAVCQSGIKDDKQLLSSLECGHVFHCACVMEWISRSAVCPVCKRQVSMDGIVTALGHATLSKVAPLKRRSAAKGTGRPSPKIDTQMLDQQTISADSARVLTRLLRDDRQVALHRTGGGGQELGPAARALAMEIEVLGPRQTSSDMLDHELQRWFGVHAASAIVGFARSHASWPGPADTQHEAVPSSMDASTPILDDSFTLAELMHQSLRVWEFRGSSKSARGVLVDSRVSDLVAAASEAGTVFIPMPTTLRKDRPGLSHGVLVSVPIECILRWLPQASGEHVLASLQDWSIDPLHSYDGTVAICPAEEVTTTTSHDPGLEDGAAGAVGDALRALAGRSSKQTLPVQAWVLPASVLGLLPPIESGTRCPAFDFASLGLTLLQFCVTGLLLPAPYLVREASSERMRSGSDAGTVSEGIPVDRDAAKRVTGGATCAVVYSVDLAGILWISSILGIRRLARLAETCAMATEGLLSARTCAPLAERPSATFEKLVARSDIADPGIAPNWTEDSLCLVDVARTAAASGALRLLRLAVGRAVPLVASCGLATEIIGSPRPAAAMAAGLSGSSSSASQMGSISPESSTDAFGRICLRILQSFRAACQSNTDLLSARRQYRGVLEEELSRGLVVPNNPSATVADRRELARSRGPSLAADSDISTMRKGDLDAAAGVGRLDVGLGAAAAAIGSISGTSRQDASVFPSSSQAGDAVPARGIRYVVLGRVTAPQTLDYLGSSGINRMVSELLQASLAASPMDNTTWRVTRPIGFNESDSIARPPCTDALSQYTWPQSDSMIAFAPLVQWIEQSAEVAGPVACAAYIGARVQEKVAAQGAQEQTAALERLRSESVESMKQSWRDFWRRRQKEEYKEAIRQGFAGAGRREQLIRLWHKEDTLDRKSKRERILRKIVKLRKAHSNIAGRGWMYLHGELVVRLATPKLSVPVRGDPAMRVVQEGEISDGGVVGSAASERGVSRRRRELSRRARGSGGADAAGSGGGGLGSSSHSGHPPAIRRGRSSSMSMAAPAAGPPTPKVGTPPAVPDVRGSSPVRGGATAVSSQDRMNGRMHARPSSDGTKVRLVEDIEIAAAARDAGISPDYFQLAAQVYGSDSAVTVPYLRGAMLAIKACQVAAGSLAAGSRANSAPADMHGIEAASGAGASDPPGAGKLSRFSALLSMQARLSSAQAGPALPLSGDRGVTVEASGEHGASLPDAQDRLAWSRVDLPGPLASQITLLEGTAPSSSVASLVRELSDAASVLRGSLGVRMEEQATITADFARMCGSPQYSTGGQDESASSRQAEDAELFRWLIPSLGAGGFSPVEVADRLLHGAIASLDGKSPTLASRPDHDDATGSSAEPQDYELASATGGGCIPVCG